MEASKTPTAPMRWPKIAGEALLLVPVVALAWAGLSEVAGGDYTGVQHIVEVIPLAAFAVIAWRWPRLGGVLLAGISVLLIATYVGFALTNGERGPAWLWLVVGLVLFAPPLLGGALFWHAGGRTGQSAARAA